MPIGSLGFSKDLRVLLGTGCWEHEPWDPSGKIEWWVDGPQPFDPSCKECKDIARKKLMARGLGHSQIRPLFRRVGAKYPWGKPTVSGGSIPKKKPSPYRPVHRKLGDRVFFVDRITPEHEQANTAHREAWAKVIEAREQILETEPGVDQLDLIRRVPDPDLPVYRQSTERA